MTENQVVSTPECVKCGHPYNPKMRVSGVCQVKVDVSFSTGTYQQPCYCDCVFTATPEKEADGVPWCESCQSWHVTPKDAAHKAVLQCTAPIALEAERESDHSPSSQAWHNWFDQVGEEATVNVVNATSKLVIAEREIYARAVKESAEAVK